MKLNKLSVSFEAQDMHFLKKYGFFRAAKMVKNHFKAYNTPFINDTYQLAFELKTFRKKLFEISKNTKKHYKQKILHKKNGGIRIINSPDAELKFIQSNILKNILNKIEASPYAMAYIKGKRLSDNASPHINHKYLLKMDITDFFGSITYLQVLSTAFNSKMYTAQIGAMLTSLCCLNEALPQGAPTSPMLSNIVMKNFDNTLGSWCKKRNITYTRYCDDLTFSADTPLSTVYLKAQSMLEDGGFEVNEKKTKFVKNTASQRVTGLTVNQKVTVPREYKRQLRSDVYYALKFGLDDSIIKGNKTEFMQNGYPDGRRYFNHLQGKINYILSVEPENDWFSNAANSLEWKYYYSV